MLYDGWCAMQWSRSPLTPYTYMIHITLINRTIAALHSKAPRWSLNWPLVFSLSLKTFSLSIEFVIFPKISRFSPNLILEYQRKNIENWSNLLELIFWVKHFWPWVISKCPYEPEHGCAKVVHTHYYVSMEKAVKPTREITAGLFIFWRGTQLTAF